MLLKVKWRIVFLFLLLLLALSEIIINFKNKEFWFYLLISSSTLSGLQSGLCRDTMTFAIHILCTFLRIYPILYVFFVCSACGCCAFDTNEGNCQSLDFSVFLWMFLFLFIFYDYWSNITGFSGYLLLWRNFVFVAV